MHFDLPTDQFGRLTVGRSVSRTHDSVGNIGRRIERKTESIGVVRAEISVFCQFDDVQNLEKGKFEIAAREGFLSHFDVRCLMDECDGRCLMDGGSDPSVFRSLVHQTSYR